MNENFDKGRRVRVNVSITAKGLVQPEVTVELLNTEKVITVNDPNDVANITESDQVDAIFNTLQKIKKRANKDGLRMVWEV